MSCQASSSQPQESAFASAAGLIGVGAAVGVLATKFFVGRNKKYVPPTVWKFVPQGGQFGSINRPTAGPRTTSALPKGSHSLQLHSLATPNGQKVTCLLEELNLRYGVEYDAWPVNIGQGDQFASGFVSANPNSKIPALLHYDDDDARQNNKTFPTRIFESAAIMMYLCEKFDIHHEFLPDASDPLRPECLSWLFWVQGSAPFLGGGFGHFYAYAPIKIPYAIDRYTMETKRQLDVLERRLSGDEDDTGTKAHWAGGPYLCGTKFTIADICCYPWYGNLVLGKGYKDAHIFLNAKEYPHVLAWAKRIQIEREGVNRGMIVNKVMGDGPALKERHSAKDFEVAFSDAEKKT